MAHPFESPTPASGITIQPGESLVDYMERIRPRNGAPVAQEPSIASRVATAVSPYVPDYAREIMGTDKPLASYSRDFPERAEFVNRISETLGQKVISDGAGGKISPAEYAAVQMGMKPNEVTEKYAARTLLPFFSGEQDMEGMQGQMARMVLEKLKSQSLAGADRKFTGQTLAEREGRMVSPLSEGRYVTSAGMDENLAAQGSYNLLSTMSRDPRYQPNYAGAMSGIASTVGSIASLALAGGDSEPGTVGGDTNDLFYYRNILSKTNPAQARALEGIYWDNQMKKGQASKQYRSSFDGGFSPQASYTTGEGMARQFNDTANWLGFAQEMVIPQVLSGTPMYTPAMRHPGLLGTENYDPGKTLRTVAADLNREVPIVPEGGHPVRARSDAQQAEKNIRAYLDPQLRKFINEYPLYQRSYNKFIDGIPGTLGTGLEPFKVQKYSFPSPALNMAANLPKYYMDLPTVLSLGAALPYAAAKGTAGAVAKTAAKDIATDMLYQEVPIGAGLHLAEQPYSSDPMRFFQPIKTGDVLDEKGMPADPNDSRYPEYHQNMTAGHQKLLDGLLKYGVQTNR